MWIGVLTLLLAVYIIGNIIPGCSLIVYGTLVMYVYIAGDLYNRYNDCMHGVSKFLCKCMHTLRKLRCMELTP